MTLKKYLQALRSQWGEHPRWKRSLREVEDIVASQLGLTWSQLKVDQDRNILPEDKKALERLLERFFAGEPSAYILGEKEFFKSSFKVDARVLIPRPETEILVEAALQIQPTPSRFIDLGAGSGCIGLSLAKVWPKSQGILVEASAEAIQVCATNVQSLGVVNVELIKKRIGEDDWSPKEPVDLIVANPPYIAVGDPRVETSVADYEPAMALYAADRGLHWIRLWLAWAFQHLSPGGYFIFEFGKGQEAEIEPLLQLHAWSAAETLSDYSHEPRFFLLKK